METLNYVQDAAGARYSTPQFRRFVLERRLDVNGVSGSGIVAAGVVFPSGKCVTQWRATPEIPVGSVVFYDTIAQIVAIHGHDGATVIRFLDSFFQSMEAGGFDVVDEMLAARPLVPSCDAVNGNDRKSVVAKLIADPDEDDGDHWEVA